MKLFDVDRQDGEVVGALLPAGHYTADVDGYGIRTSPAVWALLEDAFGPVPSDAWRQVALRNEKARMSYARLAAGCWDRLDVIAAVRYRGIAEGLEQAAHTHVEVIAEVRAAAVDAASRATEPDPLEAQETTQDVELSSAHHINETHCTDEKCSCNIAKPSTITDPAEADNNTARAGSPDPVEEAAIAMREALDEPGNRLLAPWEELDDGQREFYLRMARAVVPAHVAQLARLARERDEALFSAQQSRHGQRINEAAVLGKLREVEQERDLAQQSAEREATNAEQLRQRFDRASRDVKARDAWAAEVTRWHDIPATETPDVYGRIAGFLTAKVDELAEVRRQRDKAEQIATERGDALDRADAESTRLKTHLVNEQARLRGHLAAARQQRDELSELLATPKPAPAPSVFRPAAVCPGCQGTGSLFEED